MATRKLFDATTRYLTTTHDEDAKASSKSILNSNKIDLKRLKTAQIREANSSKLEINKRFLNSTMVNTLQGNRYKDSNNMYRAKKRKEELDNNPEGIIDGYTGTGNDTRGVYYVEGYNYLLEEEPLYYLDLIFLKMILLKVL